MEEVIVVLIQVASVFVLVLIGFICSKVGWLKIEASKVLSKVVLNIAGPCAVIYALASRDFTSKDLLVISSMFLATVFIYFFSWVVANVFTRVAKVDKTERGVYSNFVIFANNGFMGYPVALAVFGLEGFFYIVIINLFMQFTLFTMGIYYARKDGQERSTEPLPPMTWGLRIKSMMSMPLIGSLVALAIFVLKIDLPNEVLGVFEQLGNMMTPLSMFVVGIQLATSSFKKVASNVRLFAVSGVRLILIPAILLLCLLPFNLPPLLTAICALSAAFPAAAIPVTLAEEYGGDATLAAEGVFLSTLLSMITLPIACILLRIFII
ncbi:MAG: AEC family transporter [Clostridiales Family XIII bacterium]|jgi:predicted permease|nr:AEC family transporter [Clostridiales Family XIII bacterium]